VTEQQFYNVHEQTKYKVVLSAPESIEELTDWFMTYDEVAELVGVQHWGSPYGTNKRTVLLEGVITSEIKKWAERLENSGKKTLLIDDEELLDILKSGYLSDFAGTDAYGRHGDRICYARRYKRVKKKATKSDIRHFWLYTYPYAFRNRYGCYPPHVPTYDRHLPQFLAAKKLLGWKHVNAVIVNSDTRKFTKQIWDNPEEYIK
jgi:hypothetical protein